MTSQIKTTLQILVIISVLVVFSKQIIASSIKAAVVYPDAVTSYANLFSTIIQGMESDKRIHLSHYKFDKNYSLVELSSWLAEVKPDVLIALGQTSNDLISKMTLSIPVITSALTRPDNRHSCVCVNSEPKQLFSMLLDLKPDIKRIIYVYDETNNAWLIPFAKVAAKQFNIELIIKSANSIQEAALHYKEILHDKLAPTDAVWLPLDNTILGDVIFPEILKSAWQQKFSIFSSNPFYVKRGGLFALFADYYELGKQIADTAANIKSMNNKSIRVSALRSKSAINIRTARHIGLSISRRHINQYDIVYPHK